MSEVIAFQPKQPPGTNRGTAHCRECGHSWTAQAPLGTIILECPECHTMKGVFDFGIYPATGALWVCDCGCDLFRITDKAIYCWRCGVEPTMSQGERTRRRRARDRRASRSRQAIVAFLSRRAVAAI